MLRINRLLLSIPALLLLLLPVPEQVEMIRLFLDISSARSLGGRLDLRLICSDKDSDSEREENVRSRSYRPCRLLVQNQQIRLMVIILAKRTLIMQAVDVAKENNYGQSRWQKIKQLEYDFPEGFDEQAQDLVRKLLVRTPFIRLH